MSILSETKLAIVSRPVLVVAGTWILILAVAYGVLSLQAVLQAESTKKSGIALIQQISKEAGLPLLEKNMEPLQAALAAAAQKPGVILTWVADHQNTVVAISGNPHILPVSRGSDARGSDLEVWPAEVSIPSPHVNLAAVISYAGTRIGRVFLAIAPESGAGFWGQFIRIAVFSGLLVMLLAAALHHRQGSRHAGAIAGLRPPKSAAAAVPAGSAVACPLCGKPQAFSDDLFRPLDSAAARSADAAGESAEALVRLGDVGERADLAWVKRRVLLRCADIIRILSS